MSIYIHGGKNQRKGVKAQKPVSFHKKKGILSQNLFIRSLMVEMFY